MKIKLLWILLTFGLVLPASALAQSEENLNSTIDYSTVSLIDSETTGNYTPIGMRHIVYQHTDEIKQHTDETEGFQTVYINLKGKTKPIFRMRNPKVSGALDKRIFRKSYTSIRMSFLNATNENFPMARTKT